MFRKFRPPNFGFLCSIFLFKGSLFFKKMNLLDSFSKEVIEVRAKGVINREKNKDDQPTELKIRVLSRKE